MSSKVVTVAGVQFPQNMIDVAKSHPGMAWGDLGQKLTQAGGCKNCGDRKNLYLTIGKEKTGNTVPGMVKDGTAFFWIDSETYKGWVRGYLRAFPCPVCNKKDIAEDLITICGLPDADLTVRLDDFLPLEGKEKAHELAVHVLNLNEPRDFFLFYGKNGRGKSMLLKAICNGYRFRGIPATYVNLPDLLADIRKNFNKETRGNAEESLYEYRTRKVLVIDELDKANVTDWAGETIFRLVNHRYENKDTLLTIFANETAPDKGNYFESRISAGVSVEVAGIDMRQVEGEEKRAEIFAEDRQEKLK